MNNKKLVILILFVLIIIGIVDFHIVSNKDNKNSSVRSVEMIKDKELSIKHGDSIQLNIYSSDLVKINTNKFYKWSSSNEDVAYVDEDGIIRTNKAGTTTIEAKSNGKTIKNTLDVYDIKDIVIVVGDSRMDYFKDDNNFKQTSRYEIKYTDNKSILSNIDRLYVVSLSGMRYEWLAGENIYKKNNATNYVRDIIEDYEEKTNANRKYNIKIMFNLGVNDLAHKYLQDDTPSEVADKYLEKIDSLMDNEWHSNIINQISLNMITLFPVNDQMVDCYFPGRYNKDVIEFNETIIENSKYTVCDAYKEIGFKESYFRERTSNKECATRDGLHFSSKFDKDILYPYLIQVCAKK